MAVLIWIAHFDRWTLASWQVPTDYYGDAPETLARLKAASEGDVWPLRSQVLTRLGAPFGADWNAYPAPDKIMMIALGGLARVIGLPATANLALVLAQVAAVLAFYFVARWLRCRWEWAAAGALLFAYTYHTFHRGLAHFSLAFTWTVPLGLFAAWLTAGSRRVAWTRREAWLCLLAGFALGASNPYNHFFWLQLMGWALIWQWLGARRRANLEIGFATIAVSLVAFALTNAETWLHVQERDAVPLLARNYGGTEVYALKPVEMFIPPSFHHWDWLAFFGNRYARWSPWHGEVFLPYLGLAGIAGLVWLCCATLRRLRERRAVPGQALSVGWIIAYAGLGGVTNLLALFAGFQVFRATNRAAVFISAIVLVFLVTRLSRLTARWASWQRAGVAAALAALGVFEQLPKPEPVLDPAAVAADVKADTTFGRALEEALPAGAMVFQLPVVGFPEVVPPYAMGEYDHFRPYLATSRLRFSFGAPKARARSEWQREFEQLPAAELIHALENHGFAAVQLNRKGFADRGERLLRELAEFGYTRRVESPNGNEVAVVLRPIPDPVPPLARALTFGTGWHPRADAGWRWAYEDAALSYFNPYAEPVTAEIRFNLAAVRARELTLEHDGRAIGHWRVEEAAKPAAVVQVELAPGVNCFRLRSPERAIRQGEGRNQLRSFAVEEGSVRVKVRRPERDHSTIAGVD